MPSVAASAPPNRAVHAPVRRFVPVIRTIVPPLIVPLVGNTCVSVIGAAVYVNPFGRTIVLVPQRSPMSTIPASCGGVLATIDPPLGSCTDNEGTPPNVTLQRPAISLPKSVIESPPVALPDVFDKRVIASPTGMFTVTRNCALAPPFKSGSMALQIVKPPARP